MFTLSTKSMREGEYPTPCIYCNANVMRIIKFEWLTQTNLETHQCCSWVYSTQESGPRPIIDQHSLNYKVACVVYYSLQGYMGLIIHNVFAQQYTEYDTLPLPSIIYSCSISTILLSAEPHCLYGLSMCHTQSAYG